MKLVDILARDLNRWADTTKAYVQDANGDIWPCTSRPKLDGGSWLAKSNGTYIDQSEEAEHFPYHELSEDWSRAIVTREDWIEARSKSDYYAIEALSDIERLYSEGGPAAVYDAGYRKFEIVDGEA